MNIKSVATPLQPVPSCAKITVAGLYGPGPWNNVFHALYGTDFLAGGDAVSLASGVWNQFKNQFMGQLSSQLSIESVTVQDLASTSGTIQSYTNHAVGGHIGTAMPANVACGITWRLSEHYRGGHPRTYLCGIGDGSCVDGRTWSTSFQSAIQTAAHEFLVGVNGLTLPGSGMQPVLCAVHRVRNKVVLVPPSTPAILDGYVDHRPDSQRRRLGKDVP